MNQNSILITLVLTTYLACGSSDDGDSNAPLCRSDADCKGNRICDYDTGKCIGSAPEQNQRSPSPGCSPACPSGMRPVAIEAFCFCMDRFEASHIDATASSQGMNSGAAQSKQGVIPWTNVDWGTAVEACVAAGKRLCTAAEWEAACRGPNGYDWPYSDSYESQYCNGYQYAFEHLNAMTKLLPTGSLPKCKSSFDIFDMSGNAAEWVDESCGNNCRVFHDAGYTNSLHGFNCGWTGMRSSSHRHPEYGFRCCK